MIQLGLSHRDRRAYEAALLNSGRIDFTVRIHDRDEKVISTVSDQLLGGQVDVNMGQVPHRTCELVLLEPRRSQSWLPDGPSDAHVFADNFVSVRYRVWVNDLSDGPGWVDVPVFWGTVTGLAQDGDQVTIQASGKEVLGLAPHYLWDTMQIHKGRRRTAAIREVLEAQGERRFDLPESQAKLGKPLSLNRHAQPTHVAKAIAGGANWQLFPDGRGRWKARRWPQNRTWTFRDGENAGILTKPRISYDVSSVRNVVEVLGPEPKGPPKRIRAVSRAKAKDKMSPYRLRRNGEPRYMVEVVDSNLAKPEMEWHPLSQNVSGGGGPGNASAQSIQAVPGHWGAPSGVKHPKRWFEWRHSLIVHRKEKAKEIADRHLKNRLKAAVEAGFDAFPIPHLEEGDVVAVYSEGQHFEFVLKQFTIPLTADSPMSVGYNKRVPLSGKKRKHKKKRLR